MVEWFFAQTLRQDLTFIWIDKVLSAVCHRLSSRFFLHVKSLMFFSELNWLEMNVIFLRILNIGIQMPVLISTHDILHTSSLISSFEITLVQNNKRWRTICKLFELVHSAMALAALQFETGRLRENVYLCSDKKCFQYNWDLLPKPWLSWALGAAAAFI